MSEPKPKPKTPYTDRDRAALRALGGCCIMPGTASKRFARDMSPLADDQEAQLTEKQRAFLWKLVFTFRRQIADKSLVAHAREVLGIAADPPKERATRTGLRGMRR